MPRHFPQHGVDLSDGQLPVGWDGDVVLAAILGGQAHVAAHLPGHLQSFSIRSYIISVHISIRRPV